MEQAHIDIVYNELEDSFDIMIGERTLFTANHDDHGWSGMADIRTLVESIADEFGIILNEIGTPNV